ncbi:metabolite traffic protein EboE [Thermodesulfobacteriota bacterium]
MKWYQADLCYCQNIHAADTWDESLSAITTYAQRVKAVLCPNGPFGLGLRLSMRAARELQPQLDGFKSFLQENQMYVVTLNGFPYGTFHDAAVKGSVYNPDWSQPSRLDYTILLADILAGLLPAGKYGSISTVPLCYGKHLPDEATDNILKAARHLAQIESETGKTILLGLEPEPDCYLETTPETIDYIKGLQQRDPEAGRFVGVCVDTCHLALQQEIPLESIMALENENIPVAKIQLSAALEYGFGGKVDNVLHRFIDPVYLHQTRVISEQGTIKYPDLPAALEENPAGTWLVHFHVPLYYQGTDGIGTTAPLLSPELFHYLKHKSHHLEIETYSFDRLPAESTDVVESIVREYRFVLQQ